ncbi:MAG: GGDEF domain-containing protein [Planctomycetota bacterium]|jgi:diguanylate cyclase (GGDEF)-like protein
MKQTDAADEVEKVAGQAESKAKKLFLGSLLLSALIVVHIVYLAKQAGGLLTTLTQLFLPAVLLWSLVMTAYAFYSLLDIARQRAERLRRNIVDLSTGIFTLDYLRSSLEHERKRALEMGTSAAVAYLDLVNLERVNRSFGHTIGDIVLKGVAQLIGDGIRRGDILGRVGGDEFLIIMPETALEEAGSLVKSIREGIEGYQLDLGKRGAIDFLGCKTGVAAFPEEGHTPEEIIHAASSKLDRPVSV